MKVYKSSIESTKPRCSEFDLLRYTFLIFLTFDSLPILPTQYSPVTGYLFILFGLLEIFRFFSVRKRAFIWPYIGIGIVMVVAAFPILLNGHFGGILDFGASYLFSLLFLFIFYVFVDRQVRDRGVVSTLRSIEKFLLAAYVIGLFVGSIQVAALFVENVRPIRRELSILLAGRSYAYVQWLSSEPSWGALAMVPLFTLALYRKGRKWDLLNGMFIVQAILSVSTTVYVSVAFILAIHWSRQSTRKKVITLLILGVIGVMSPFAMQHIDVGGIRTLVRFKALNNEKPIQSFMMFSSSETIRIGFPAAAIAIASDFPFLGVGGGNTRYYLVQYLDRLFPWALEMEEIAWYVGKSPSAVTPRNLFARVAAEGGIVGVILLLMFIGLAAYPRGYRKTQRESENAQKYTLMFVATIIAFLQFDSWAYVPFLIAIVLVNVARSPGWSQSDGR